MGEKGGDEAEDAVGGGWGEEVGFAGQDVAFVGNAKALETGFERAGLIDGHDVVLFSVDDKGRGEGAGGVSGEGLNDAAGDLRDAADAWVEGGVGEGEEGSERDADQGDPRWVYAGAGADVDEGVDDSFKPLRDVDAIEDDLGGSVAVVGAVEVVRGVEGGAGLPQVRGETVGPEGGVSTGAVEVDDSRVDGIGGGFDLVEADGRAVTLDGGLHGTRLFVDGQRYASFTFRYTARLAGTKRSCHDVRRGHEGAWLVSLDSLLRFKVLCPWSVECVFVHDAVASRLAEFVSIVADDRRGRMPFTWP
jgi:hypothetical protein